MSEVSERTPHAQGAPLAAFVTADFPWYGLDQSWSGPRWLSAAVADATGAVEYGTIGHGDGPSRRPADPTPRRFASVVTVAHRPRRPSQDGTGYLDATSPASAASVAGVGLLADSWPWHLDRSLRQDWMNQQTNLAWELADELDGEHWSSLALPVDGAPVTFRYRESEYGWVLAGEVPGVYLGAYGRGLSAYGLGFAVVPDVSALASQA